MLYLAGQRPPAEGAWLWVTTAEARRGGEFTALFLPRNRPWQAAATCWSASRRAASLADEQWPLPAMLVRVMAVVAGSVIHVAAWDHLSSGGVAGDRPPGGRVRHGRPEGTAGARCRRRRIPPPLRPGRGGIRGRGGRCRVPRPAGVRAAGCGRVICGCRWHGGVRRTAHAPVVVAAMTPSASRSPVRRAACGTGNTHPLRLNGTGMPACARQGAHGGGSRGGPHAGTGPGRRARDGG